jgi:hypothetical protein
MSRHIDSAPCHVRPFDDTHAFCGAVTFNFLSYNIMLSWIFGLINPELFIEKICNRDKRTGKFLHLLTGGRR